MAEDESTSSRVARLLDTIGPFGPTIRGDPQATIVPAPDVPDTGAGRAIEALAGLTSQLGSLAKRVRLEGSLGAGGMGEVLLAEQLSVGRKVAVKRLRAGAGSDAAVSALLREGWVTGTLEHPNVMPLYDLGFDEDGGPLMILKRIEGVQWRELIADAETVAARFGTGLLEWNLQILMQLCNAVGYAHSKGIIHRDIKPENVMVGEFGEVYLLDWGIAVALDDDGTGRLPSSRNLSEIAGTPHYMAPEMLDGVAQRLSVRTDVYLLGAILYEILTGTPPHRTESLEEFVRSVVRSDPPMSADAPAELAEICRRAMASSAARRFPSAEALRLRLQAYLDHRGSAGLAEQAQRRLDELEAMADEEGTGPGRMERYRVFSECRFGFRQALQTWADNPRARRGLLRATSSMIEYELSRDDPGAAAALLAELGSEAPEVLRERVEAGLAAAAHEEAEIAELRAFREGRDSRTGRNTRRFIVGVMGVLWTLLPLIGFAAPELSAQHATFIAIPVVSMVMMGALAWWGRESVGRSFVNRSIVLGVIGALALEATISPLGMILDLPGEVVQVFHFLPWAAISGFVALSVMPRLWWIPVCYVIGMLVSAWRLDLRFVAMSVTHLLMLVGVAAWAPLASDDRK